MIYKMVLETESQLVQMVDLREAPLVESQVNIFLESLMDIHWEASLTEFQVGRLRDIRR